LRWTKEEREDREAFLRDNGFVPSPAMDDVAVAQMMDLVSLTGMPVIPKPGVVLTNLARGTVQGRDVLVFTCLFNIGRKAGSPFLGHSAAALIRLPDGSIPEFSLRPRRDGDDKLPGYTPADAALAPAAYSLFTEARDALAAFLTPQVRKLLEQPDWQLFGHRGSLLLYENRDLDRADLRRLIDRGLEFLKAAGR
jgi:hypothetical protein